jgi:N-carbamoylputrescine amidase
MKSRTVKVGLVQHSCSLDREANIAKAVAGVRAAAQRGATVVCLQELFSAPYFCQVQDPNFFDWAEPMEGPSVSSMQGLAIELGVTILAGFFEYRAPGLCHNSLVVLGPGGSLGLYRKMHIPQDPQFEEKFYFTPGDTGFIAVETPECVVGPLICWDQWYPEGARLTALQGAELLFYPTAIGWMPGEESEHQNQRSAWETIQRAHAIANGVFTVSVNRIGVERSTQGEIHFWGGSFVCAPTGEVIARAGEGEEVLVVECDLGKMHETRRVWPFLRDRRIDAYGGLTQRWGKR